MGGAYLARALAGARSANTPTYRLGPAAGFYTHASNFLPDLWILALSRSRYASTSVTPKPPCAAVRVRRHPILGYAVGDPPLRHPEHVGQLPDRHRAFLTRSLRELDDPGASSWALLGRL
jgi:hypothetical protein